MTFRICNLGSGSKGNTTYIEAGKTRVLIDAGLSGKETRKRLQSIGVKGEDLGAIVVSHEHGDHTRGLKVLSKSFNLPVYINYPTLSKLKDLENNENVREFDSGESFFFQDLLFQPFSVPHDAADPVGFSIVYNDLKIGIATDLGIATNLVKERLKKSTILLLESNHDEEMLKSGHYPWEVKQRIKSRLGHLSNEQAGSLLKDIHHEGLKHVILGHMSETNNTPEKARNGLDFFLKDLQRSSTKISMTGQHSVGNMVELMDNDR